MKKILILLLCAALLLSLAACIKDAETIADQLPLQEAVVEPEPEPEPEPEGPGLTVAVAAAPEELPESSFGQSLYLPLLVWDDEGWHSHVIDYVGLGGNSWRVTVLEGLTDSNGNAFTAEDLQALLSEKECFKDLSVAENSVTFTLASDEIDLLETTLASIYAYTSAAAAGSDIPAGFGPYLVSEIQGNTLILRQNGSCPETDCSCTAAENEKITLLCSVTPEEQAALLASGEIDVAWDLTAAVEGCEMKQFLTGESLFLVANCFPSEEEAAEASEEEETGAANAVFPLIDRSALTGDTAIAAEPLFAPGIPGSEVAAEYDPTFTGTVPTELTLSCTPEDEATAEALQEQLKQQGVTVKIITASNPCSPGKDYDLALIPCSGSCANGLISELFSADGDATAWGFQSEDALETARLMGTRYGRSETNLTLFLSYLSEDSPVTGLYSETTLSGLRAGLTCEVTGKGILLGTVRESVAE